MKGVAGDYDRDAAAGCKLSDQPSHRAGTKRRRVIKSGADELLELEGAEEDEDDKGDSEDSTHHRHHDSSTRVPRSWAQAMVDFPVDCQAMGIDTNPSPPPSHAFQPSSSSSSRHVRLSVCLLPLVLLTPKEKMAHACYEVMGDEQRQYHKKHDKRAGRDMETADASYLVLKNFQVSGQNAYTNGEMSFNDCVFKNVPCVHVLSESFACEAFWFLISSAKSHE